MGVEASELVERRREEIVLAAFKVFAERGYHGTGIADIARELGVGHGTFYRYFQNKRDIIAHVIDHSVGRVAAALATEDPAAATTLEDYRAQVKRIGAALYTLFLRDRQLAKIFFFESTSVDAELTDRVLEANSLFGEFTEAYLKNGVERGFLRADLDTRITARAINGMILAGALAGMREQSPADDSDRWVEAVTRLMFDGVRA